MRAALATLASIFAVTATGHAVVLWQGEAAPSGGGPAARPGEAGRGAAERHFGAELVREAAVKPPAVQAGITAERPTLDGPGGADAARDRRLAALYAAMPPDAAAPMIGALTPTRAATVLMLMPPHAAGAVLASLPAADAAPLASALGG